MKKIGEEVAADASPLTLTRLPDEIILQILNKLIDLKSLCFCYLVSRRISSIVLQVDAISFTTPPLLNPITPDSIIFGGEPLPPFASLVCSQSFASAVRFLCKFKRVKSLHIEVQSSSHRCNDNRLFKWKAKFGDKFESVFIISPDSISVSGKGEKEEDMALSSDWGMRNAGIPRHCLKDVSMLQRTLLHMIELDLPLLEEVSITDSMRRGRLSLSGGKLAEVKQRVLSASESLKSEMCCTNNSSWYECTFPVLELPVSGYVMKWVTLFVLERKDNLDGDDVRVMVCKDGFEDEEDGAYNEACVEILKKHKARMDAENEVV